MNPGFDIKSPIIPVLVGTEEAAVKIAGQLRESGYFIPAIRFPTVARGKARLRISVNATHSKEEVSRLCAALLELKIPSAIAQFP